MELWETLQNPTTFYLLVFVSGNSAFAQLTPITYTYIQYTLVNLTNLMAGAQVIFTYLAVAGGIRIFQVGRAKERRSEGARKRGREGVRKWERERVEVLIFAFALGTRARTSTCSYLRPHVRPPPHPAPPR